MEIDLLQLKTVVNRLLDHAIETRGVRKCELTKNYYWVVPEESLYEMNNKPAELDVGSLHDDWEFVRGLLSKDSNPVAYQLTEVAPILHYLGEVLARDLAKVGG